MQQILQNIRNGELAVHQIPAPMVRDGQVLIANRASLVSAGTEKMVLELSKKSLPGKARERPDHVRRVLEKVRNEGLWQDRPAGPREARLADDYGLQFGVRRGSGGQRSERQ